MTADGLPADDVSRPGYMESPCEVAAHAVPDSASDPRRKGCVTIADCAAPRSPTWAATSCA